MNTTDNAAAVTVETIAAALDGRQYGDEVPHSMSTLAKAAGIAIVYGTSDDLIEFDGAISDELGAKDGQEFHLGPRGLILPDCEAGKSCPAYQARVRDAATLTANWDADGFSWTYTTAIPHAQFVINEGDETYCRGIVFRLADVPDAAAPRFDPAADALRLTTIARGMSCDGPEAAAKHVLLEIALRLSTGGYQRGVL